MISRLLCILALLLALVTTGSCCRMRDVEPSHEFLGLIFAGLRAGVTAGRAGSSAARAARAAKAGRKLDRQRNRQPKKIINIPFRTGGALQAPGLKR